jgi:hypothetical protein
VKRLATMSAYSFIAVYTVLASISLVLAYFVYKKKVVECLKQKRRV